MGYTHIPDERELGVGTGMIESIAVGKRVELSDS